jgi:hypothetical protein
LLVQVAEAAHTGLIDRSSDDQKLVHIVVFVFNGTFRCQHCSIDLQLCLRTFIPMVEGSAVTLVFESHWEQILGMD